MRLDRPPYWHWPLDRWNVLVIGLLVVALAVAAASGRAVLQPGRITPAITQPAPGDTLDSATPGAIAGRAAPGASVRIFDGDKLLGETKADQAGFFRLMLPVLAPGRHALTTRVVDAAGHVVASSASITVAVTGGVAAPKPAASVSAAPARSTAAALAPAAPAAVAATKAVTASLAAPATARPGSATPGPLATAAQDVPGATASPAPAPPKEGANAVVGAPIAVAGSAAAAALLRIYDGETLLGEAAADAQGQWNLVIPSLAVGRHTITARVFAGDGKLVSSSAPMIVTVAPPTPGPTAAGNAPGAAGTPGAAAPPQITAPKPGAELSAVSPVLLEGVAPPGSRVFSYDGEKLLIEAAAASDGSWRVVLPPLAAGAHTLAARILGPGGSEQASSAPLAVTVKPAPAAAPATAAPAAGRPNVSEPASGRPVQSGQPVFGGTAEPNGIVRVYDGDILLGETRASAQGRWSLVSPFVLATGQHGLRAVGVGADGAETLGAAFELTIAPGATGAKPPAFVPATGKGASRVGLLQGVAPPGLLVSIVEDSTMVARVKADAGGSWQYALPNWTAAGQHTYTITAATADGAVVYHPEPLTVSIEPAAQ